MDLMDAPARRSQPRDSYMALTVEEADRQLRRYAARLGLLAVLIPVLVPGAAGVAAWRQGGWCLRDSLSHFYYSPAGGNVFVILLSLIAGALMFYRGENRVEGRLASAAGLAMLVVAFVPTSGGGCDAGRMQARGVVDAVREGSGGGVPGVELWRVAEGNAAPLLFETAGSAWVHYGAATVLFLILATFCLRVFTRVRTVEHGTGSDSVDVARSGALKPEKVVRNRLYRAGGVVILAAMAAMLARAFAGEGWSWWERWNLTLWLEALALAAFGLSWLLKGRFFGGFLASRP